MAFSASETLSTPSSIGSRTTLTHDGTLHDNITSWTEEVDKILHTEDGYDGHRFYSLDFTRENSIRSLAYPDSDRDHGKAKLEVEENSEDELIEKEQAGATVFSIIIALVLAIFLVALDGVSNTCNIFGAALSDLILDYRCHGYT